MERVKGSGDHAVVAMERVKKVAGGAECSWQASGVGEGGAEHTLVAGVGEAVWMDDERDVEAVGMA